MPFKGGIFLIWLFYACNVLWSPPNLDWRISLASLYFGSETPKPLMVSRAIPVRLCHNLGILIFVGSTSWLKRLVNISQKSSNLFFSPLNTGTFKGLSRWLQLPEWSELDDWLRAGKCVEWSGDLSEDVCSKVSSVTFASFFFKMSLIICSAFSITLFTSFPDFLLLLRLPSCFHFLLSS